MKQQGQFEALYKDIEDTIKEAEGGWCIRDGVLEVETIVSRDVSRSRNGGEYSHWREFHPDGIGGVYACGCWSAEFDYERYNGDDTAQYDCLVSLDGLKRMAQMADLTIAARAWMAKEKGCMAKLKRAVRSLGDD